MLNEYLAQYQPEERLFSCTARNMEYVLHDISERAGISPPITFETLRATCALRDHQAGMSSDTLRQKMGLSQVTWRETFEKIKKLASPPL